MFELVRNNKRIVQIILGLLVIPFALFGLDAFQRSGGGSDAIAEVGGSPITRQDFARSMQEQQERMRQMLGRSFDPAILDTPEARDGLLDSLISQRLLGNYVVKNGLLPNDGELQTAIARIDAFQEGGKFSIASYRRALEAQRLTPVQFEESYRQDLALQRLNLAVGDAVIQSKSLTEWQLTAQIEEREIAEFSFAASAYAGQANITADAVAKYYQENAKEFAIPEQIRVEYVVLNQEIVASRETVTVEEVRSAYDKTLGPQATARAAARAKIDAIWSTLKKSPDDFAALAKASSQDEGSTGAGGDLGVFGRGMMVKAFEEAVYRLKVGEISDVVESEFGFHVIRLAEVRPGAQGEERRASHILIKAAAATKPFELARIDIEADLRRQRGASRFAKEAERFQQLADQDHQSLDTFIKEFKLTTQTTEWISRASATPQTAGALANPRVLDTLFAPESTRSKRATQAIEAGQNVMIVARVAEHKAASQRPIEEARGEIQKSLEAREAAQLARKAGAAKLAEIQKDLSAVVKWSAVKSVSRSDAKGLSREAIQAVLRADPAKLPGFVGVDTADGYALYRVSKVAQGTPDAKRENEFRTSLARSDSRDQGRAFVAGLRERGKIDINRANLERKN